MNDRLRELILKRAVDQHKGLKIDDDIVTIFDKKYLVNCIFGNVKEVK